ncbi:MAG: hypothetical protein IK152_01705 [Lachnospiraceae bacterium]|nr:hypothetical protein [Lachnospiraceae bacterium]
MKCQNCGAEVNGSVCQYCGSRVDEKNQTVIINNYYQSSEEPIQYADNVYPQYVSDKNKYEAFYCNTV